MLKKNYFQWDDKAKKYFEDLEKEIMPKALVLATLNFSKTFVIKCEASSFGIGAVLMQEGHPIAFDSKKLNK